MEQKIITTYKLPLLLGGASVFVIVISIILLIKSVAATTPIRFSRSTDEASASGQASRIAVDVEGAVLRPGLYSLPEGSRAEDAITAAGGFAKDVDEEAFAKTINRAMKLVDGAKIFIPILSSSSVSTLSDLNTLVSVNTGTETQLDTLSGVGLVTAKKIIDNRPYQTLEELVSKKAVGAALFEKIKTQISL